jgi:prevent-host-death family protein
VGDAAHQLAQILRAWRSAAWARSRVAISRASLRSTTRNLWSAWRSRPPAAPPRLRFNKGSRLVLPSPAEESPRVDAVSIEMDHLIAHSLDKWTKCWLEGVMLVSVSDAKAQLTDLVRRAEAGDEVVLTRHGLPAVRLVAIKTAGDRATRRRVLELARTRASKKAVHGTGAAESADFLYDAEGLPR